LKLQEMTPNSPRVSIGAAFSTVKGPVLAEKSGHWEDLSILFKNAFSGIAKGSNQASQALVRNDCYCPVIVSEG
jgi:hypothetical protein